MGCLLQVEQCEAHEFSATNAIMLLNEHTVCTKNLAFHFHPIVQISRRVPKAVKICFRTTPTSAGCYQALPTTLAALPGTKIDLKYRCPGVPRSSTMLGKCFIFHGQSHGHFMGISWAFLGLALYSGAKAS
jgi:metallophosphoesterase superfamily enzyme